MSKIYCGEGTSECWNPKKETCSIRRVVEDAPAKVEVGSYVKYGSAEKHQKQSFFYPKVGTIGVVVYIDSGTIDNCKVQWEIGSTSMDDLWWASEEDLTVVDKPAEKKSVSKFAVGDHVRIMDSKFTAFSVGNVGKVVHTDVMSLVNVVVDGLTQYLNPDQLEKTTAEFCTGDEVRVINDGKRYSTYEDWFKTNLPSMLSRYEGDAPENGRVGKVLHSDRHGKLSVPFLVAVDFGSNGVGLIEQGGLELASKKPAKAEETRGGFRIGEKVRVINNSTSRFSVGDIVTITSFDDWADDAIMTEKGGHTQILRTNMVEKIDQPSKKAPFKVGDYVKGLPNSRYNITSERMTVGLVESVTKDMIKVKVIQHVAGITGSSFDVEAKYFEKIDYKPETKSAPKATDKKPEKKLTTPELSKKPLHYSKFSDRATGDGRVRISQADYLKIVEEARTLRMNLEAESLRDLIDSIMKKLGA